MMKDFTAIINQELVNDEKVIWTGMPAITKIFTMSDIFTIPFSLIWGGSSLLWEINAIDIVYGVGRNRGIFGLIFVVFGIPFVLLGLYLVFGRYIVKIICKKRTAYVITNYRIIRIKSCSKVRIAYKVINQIVSMDLSIQRKGIGTIRFGEVSPFIKFFSNTGLEVPWIFHFIDVLSFYDIKDAATVHDIINVLRRDGLTKQSIVSL